MHLLHSMPAVASEAKKASFWDFHPALWHIPPSGWSRQTLLATDIGPAPCSLGHLDSRRMSMGSRDHAWPAADPVEAEVAGASCHPLLWELPRKSGAVSLEASEAAGVAEYSEPATSNADLDARPYLREEEEEACSPTDHNFLYLQCQRDRPTEPDPSTDLRQYAPVGSTSLTMPPCHPTSGCFSCTQRTLA